jgi:hypothetical protein
MGALLPLLLPVIPGLVNLAEAAFEKPKSGESKMNAVIAALQGMLGTLFGAGQAPSGAAAPGANELQGVVETVLAQMKGNGTITTPGKASASTQPQLWLVQGTVSQLKTA